MTKQEVFQHNLPYIRKVLGLSCAELAAYVGVPRGAVMHYEQNGPIKDKTKQQLMYCAFSCACVSVGRKVMEGKDILEFMDFMDMFKTPVDPNNPKWNGVRRGV